MSAAGTLLEAYVTSQPDDAARALESIDAASAADVLAAVETAAAARVLQGMSPPAASRRLGLLPPDAAAAIGSHLPIDVLAGLLRRLDPDAAAPVLDGLPSDSARGARQILSSAEGTAGAVMDPLVPVVQADATADDVRHSLQQEFLRLHDYVYVVDSSHVLVGVVDAGALAAADAATPVRSVTRNVVMFLPIEMPLQAVLAHPGWQQFDALPVVDERRHFAGVLRHRRLRQAVAQLEVAAAGDRTVRTLMALGEVYWLGLCGLMQGLATTAAAPVGSTNAGGSR